MNAYPRFYELIRRRFSCRHYDNRPVEHDLLTAVLDTARLAPSACNRQPWIFLIAERSNPEHKELCDAISASYDREWIRTAPVYILACGDHNEAWHRSYDGKDHTDVDVSIAVEHICLGAATLGLQTCWVCNFDPAPIRTAFGLPEHIEPVALIPIGYPSTEPKPKTRKEMDQIVKWGKF